MYLMRIFAIVVIIVSFSVNSFSAVGGASEQNSNSELSFARVFTAKVEDGMNKTLQELEAVAREHGTIEILTFPRSEGPEAVIQRKIDRVGSKEHLYPGFTWKVRKYLADAENSGQLQLSKDRSSGVVPELEADYKLSFEFSRDLRSPLIINLSKDGEIIAITNYYEVVRPDGQRYPATIRIDMPKKNDSIIQVFEYLDSIPTEPEFLPKIYTEGKAEKKTEIDQIDQVHKAEQGSPASGSVSFSVSHGPSWDWDSGYQPAGFPVQVRLAVGAGLNFSSSISGDFTLDRQTTYSGNLKPNNAQGSMGVDMGIELVIEGSLDVWIIDPIFFPIPYAPNFDFRYKETKSFNNYLLDSSVMLSHVLAKQTLFAVPVTGVAGVGSIDAAVQVKLSVSGTMTANSISTSDGKSFTYEGQSLSVPLNNGEYSTTLNYNEKLTAATTVTFYPTLCASILGGLGSYCLPTDQLFGGISVDIISGTIPLSFSNSTLSFSEVPKQEGNQLSLAGFQWDDSGSAGDRDGVMEAGEKPRLKIKISSNATAGNVQTTLSTTDSNINITEPKSYYQQFTSGQSQWQVGSYKMDLNFALSTNQTRESAFNLHVTYEVNGQRYSQNFPFTYKFRHQGDHGSFQVLDFTLDDSPSIRRGNNGDGVFQSGEEIHLRPRLQYTGLSTATSVDVSLINNHTAIELNSATERYPDFQSGHTGYPSGNDFYRVTSVDKSFSGTIGIDAEVTWREGSAPVVLNDALSLSISPIPILSVTPSISSFGIKAPGENVVHTITVKNIGSVVLSVTDIQANNADTTIPTSDLDFNLNPGQQKDIQVTIDTSNIESGTDVVRTIKVISNGRLFDNGVDNAVITGLVSELTLVHQVPALTGHVYNPDISGSWIVWQEMRNNNWDIYAYNFITEEEIRVTDNSASQGVPRISGNLIVWMDDRNWDGVNEEYHDIYGYDLTTRQEFPISTDPYDEQLLGVDGDKVAFNRVYHRFTDADCPNAARNAYLYDYSTKQTQNLTNYTSNTSHSPMSNVSGDNSYGADFSGGLLIFKTTTYSWLGSYVDWECGRNDKILKYKVGIDSTPSILSDRPFMESLVSSDDNKAVWVEYGRGGSDSHIWIWENNAISQVTFGEEDYADDELAIGGNFIVYDIRSENKIYYRHWNPPINQEYLLADHSASYLRMDGNAVVWRSLDASRYNIYYAFIQQSDIGIAPGDITFSNSAPVEGESITVSVLIRNLTDFPNNEDFTVKLFGGDPDNGGILLGQDGLISGGIAAKGQAAVEFTGIQVPNNSAGAKFETRHFYVRVIVPGHDNVSNNTAVKDLIIIDNDIVGPVIANVTVAESNGDGDGLIGDDEKVLISWTLQDPSGIGSTTLKVDGQIVSHTGSYQAEVGPLTRGSYDFVIDATDNDNSSQSTSFSDSFNVRAAEKIDIVAVNLGSVNNESTVYLGNFSSGFPVDEVLFYIYNRGEQTLSLNGLSIPTNFTSPGLTATSIKPGEFTSFSITPNNSALGQIPEGQVSISNSDSTQNPFTFKVKANIVEDVDSDGLPDWWEYNIVTKVKNDSITRVQDVLIYADFDEDGFTNKQEYDYGTDPADQNSFPISVTILLTTGGSTDRDGVNVTNYDGSLTITVAPDTGYHFTNWSGDASGTSNPLTISNITSDMTITANFALKTYNVTVNSSPAAGGSTSKNGVNVVNHGDSLVITVTENAGYNFTGWSGDASGTTNPLTISNITSAKTITAHFAGSLAVGHWHSLFIKPNGSLWAWGRNVDGRLGDGTTTDRSVPIQVGTSTDWVAVTGGAFHTLGLKPDGPRWAWGYNLYGQLGDGTTSTRITPVQVGSSTDWVAVNAGSSHTLGIKTGGTLWAWGINNHGQLGDGTTSTRITPVQVGSSTDWVAVTAFLDYRMGIKKDGTLWAWGRNDRGQLGDETTTDKHSPVQVGASTDWVAVNAGAYHTLGIKSDGTLWAWGYNDNGQLGDGTTSNRYSPVQVGSSTDWKSITAGYYHSLGIKFDGTLWAWGDNGYGQLGDGTTTERHSPVQVGASTDWEAVTAGHYHTLGIKSDGTLWAWGNNQYGQVGDGTTTDSHSPKIVLFPTDTCTNHSADYNTADWSINLSELLRVIQFYNIGDYYCDVSGEDGFGTGAGDQTCTPHDSDYNTQDWSINFSELLRLIQLYNIGAYHCDPEGEDGFAPGP